MGRTRQLAEARQLAEDFAANLLRRYGADLNKPVDIHALVDRIGLPVEKSDIKQDGRLRSGPVPTILVKGGQSTPRERFTIAHELGHWAMSSQDAPAAELQEAFSSEEVLCNTLAAALLMPHPWVTSGFRVASRDQNLAIVRQMAQSASVSLSAAVIRLRDVFEWRKTLLHWSRVEGEWLFDGEAGVNPWEQGAVIPCSSVVFALNEVRNAGRGIQRCALPLQVFRCEQDIAAEALPLRKGVAVLIDAPELAKN